MLHSMRRHSQSWIIYILFGMLIFVFVFMFGLPTTDSCNPQTKAEVAEVGDFSINEDQLRSAVLLTYGDNVGTQEEEFRAAQRSVLYSMVTVLLIAQKAEDAGMRVSEEELRAYIVDPEKGNPDTARFINDLVFDNERYQNFLNYYGTTEAAYERYKRRELMALNYLSLLQASILVDEQELREVYAQRQERIDLSFVKLQKKHIAHLIQEPTAAEIQSFLAENLEAAKSYREENKNEFDTPATVHLKEIVVQKDNELLTKPGMKTDATKSPAERFETIKNEVLVQKKDFDQAATDYNEAFVYRENGGDRGTERLELIPQRYRDALEGKKAGDIVEFESDQTFNLVYLVERDAGVQPSFESLKDEVATRMIREKAAQEMLDKVAAEVHTQALAGEDMQQALDNVIASLTPPAPSPAPTMGPDGLPVPAVAEDTAEVDPVVPATVELTGPFSPRGGVGGAWDRVPKIGESAELMRALAEVTEAGKVLPKIYSVKDAKIIAKVAEYSGWTEEDFQAARADLMRNLQAGKAAELLGDWNSLLRLRVPEPSVRPYGPWIQAIFENAQDSGAFSINQSLFAPPAQEGAEQEG